VTIAIRPFEGRDGDEYESDLGLQRTEIFLQKGLDRSRAEQPDGQISVALLGEMNELARAILMFTVFRSMFLP
jgi:hypothetical protein